MQHHPLASLSAAAAQQPQMSSGVSGVLGVAGVGIGVAVPGGPGAADPLSQRLAQMNEETWVRIGSIADSLGDKDRALAAFDAALRHNPFSVPALTSASALCRQRELFPRAIELFQRLLNIDRYNGAVWAALGHCFLMIDDLQNAYQTYQQALNYLSNPKDAKLWYGIGVLYDRYGSFDHAEAAFASVLRIDPRFDKGNEIYFRLGIIYKHQQKYNLSLDCFKYILGCPPKPLSEVDVWFQIGHVHEFQRDYNNARGAYETGLQRNPNSAKILQQLGWLYMQAAPGFQNYDQAITFLTRAMEIDSNDAQTYYLLGRCQMAKQKPTQAYDFYQQAVLRDAKNPIFWCSIGVLYFELGQHRDALDAYSRAIYLNPSIPEIWCNLGKLYESCNSQTADAIDAYTKAVELEPNNQSTKHRLAMLRAYQGNAGPQPGPPEAAVHPMPQDPSTYILGGAAGKPQNVSSSSFFPSTRTLPQGPQQPVPPVTQQQSQQHLPPQYQADRRRSLAQPQMMPNGGMMGAQNMVSRGPSPHVPHANGQPQYMQQHAQAPQPQYAQHPQVHQAQQSSSQRNSGMPSPQQVAQPPPYQQSTQHQQYQQQSHHSAPPHHSQMPSQSHQPPPQAQHSGYPQQQSGIVPPSLQQQQVPSPNFPRASGSPSMHAATLRPTSPTAMSHPPIQAPQEPQSYQQPPPQQQQQQTAPTALHQYLSYTSNQLPTGSDGGRVLTPTSQTAPVLPAQPPVQPTVSPTSATSHPSGLGASAVPIPVAQDVALSHAPTQQPKDQMDVTESTSVGSAPGASEAPTTGENITIASVEAVPEAMRKVDDDYDGEEGEEEEEGALEEARGDEAMGEAEDEEEVEEGGVPPAQ
ncbi:hypothetical protein BC830DRAFT_1168439 [Chytriomyces sp. MP71]|nr:hypothetical protein BC830DRAFT_1168439 [Chytriomyces sp. MP71]